MLRSYPVYSLGLDQVTERLHQNTNHVFPPANLCVGSSSYESKRFLDLDALKADFDSLLLYGNVMGEQELRDEIASLLSRQCGTEISPRRILITEGASGAIAVALMTLVEPGESVVLPKVFFPAYTTAVHLVGATCQFAELDSENNVTPESVRAVATPKTTAMIINSPGNPYGNVLTRAQMEALLECGVPIISDEVYTHLGTDEKAASLLDVTQEHFVCGSFSKTYAAAGLRVGFLVLPERLVDTAFAVRVTMNVCPSLPSQKLSLALVRNHDTIVQEHRAYLSEHRAFFERCCALHRIKLVVPPKQGFFGLADVREFIPKGSLQFALDLAREMNVATAPGSDFAIEDPGFVRLNYSADIRTIEAGISRLRGFLTR